MSRTVSVSHRPRVTSLLGLSDRVRLRRNGAGDPVAQPSSAPRHGVYRDSSFSLSWLHIKLGGGWLCPPQWVTFTLSLKRVRGRAKNTAYLSTCFTVATASCSSLIKPSAICPLFQQTALQLNATRRWSNARMAGPFWLPRHTSAPGVLTFPFPGSQ